MIRFNCSNCDRFYELPDALAKLPLVCKQCGQRITPPEPSPEPPEQPKPVAKPQAAPPPAIPVAPKLPPGLEPVEADDVLVSKPDSTPDIDFDIGGPTAASISEANRPRPKGLSNPDFAPPVEATATQAAKATSEQEINLDLLPKSSPPPSPPWKPKPPEPEEPQSEEKPRSALLPLLVDLGVFLILVGGGLLVGELLARKPTMQIVSEAGSAPKFPPVDLLLWLAPAVLLALVYLLLSKRKRTLGAWLRRRREAAS